MELRNFVFSRTAGSSSLPLSYGSGVHTPDHLASLAGACSSDPWLCRSAEWLACLPDLCDGEAMQTETSVPGWSQ